MPIIVTCPSCSGQLRVADDLLGRKVRCPACNATFTSTREASPEAPPPVKPPAVSPLEAPVETEKVDAWKMLDLELDQAGTKPAAPLAPPPEPVPAPPPLPDKSRAEPERSPAPRQRARLNDDHDDLRPCPSCGRLVHYDRRRCTECGARLRDDGLLDEDDDYVSIRKRRDYEPHRGGFILAMGVISVASIFVCPLLIPVAIVPGLIAWVLGGIDLRRMREGHLDPDGHGSTQAGWICGIIGTLLNTLIVLGCGTILGLGIWADTQRSRNLNQPAFQPPPPVVK
ncbi:MAG: MJ0042-type zinc finger domain-containing protein [Gemmataceae bacterium]